MMAQNGLAQQCCNPGVPQCRQACVVGDIFLRLCQGRVTRQKKTLHAIIRKAKYLMQPMLDKTELTDPSSQKQLPASSPATMVKNHLCSVAAPATGVVHQLHSWLQAPQY